MTKEIQTKILDTTEDTGDPVVRVVLGNSKADVIIDRQDECLNVWTIESAEEGDMKEMMDYLVEKIGYTWVQFIAPMGDEEKELADKIIDEVGVSEDKKFENDDNNRNIKEVLDGFQEVTEHHQGKEIPMLVGFWNTQQ